MVEKTVMREHEIFKALVNSPVISEAEAKQRLAFVAGVEVDTFRKWTRKAGKDVTDTGARGPLGRLVAIMREGWLFNPDKVWSLLQFQLDEYELLVRAQSWVRTAWNRRDAANQLLDASTEAVKALNQPKSGEADRQAYELCLKLRGTLDQTIEGLRREITTPEPKHKYDADAAARLQLASRR